MILKNELDKPIVEITRDNIDTAYEAAEQLTEMGYEVSKPTTYDFGKTYTFTARLLENK